MARFRALLALLLAVFAAGVAAGDSDSAQARDQVTVLVGPLNAEFPSAGEAIRKDLASPITAGSDWTMKGWVRADTPTSDPRIVAALVDQSGAALVRIGFVNGRVFAGAGDKRTLSSASGKRGEWLLVTLASSGGNLSLKVGNTAPVAVSTGNVESAVALVLAQRAEGKPRFTGAVSSLLVWQGKAKSMRGVSWAEPNADLFQFESASPGWPVQVKQSMGLDGPQDPMTLPVSRTAAATTATGKQPRITAPLTPASFGRWSVGAWRFVAEPETAASGVSISASAFDARAWLPATVPGTVLTSYVDNGIYPDPAYGLNNLQIPEKLNKQRYWYRTEFTLPEGASAGQRTLVFEGINYAAEIWVNGERLGSTEGAFVRGRFEIPARLLTNRKVAVAVLVSPPPHPGIPHEESLVGGPGLNGGIMTIDGPTFMASEGWDWIPGVRDRNTGIWQDVVLEVTGAVRLGDPHVRTVLPRSDNSLAELTVEVPVINAGLTPIAAEVAIGFGETTLTKTVDLGAEASAIVRFEPERFEQLRIKDPELWWPNGYGEPTLHNMALSVTTNGAVSDSSELRFGLREISYELSAVDAAEELQRVMVAPTRSLGEQLLAVDHPNIRKVAGGWAISLARDIASSPALALAPDTALAPHLVVRVNGVPIAVRGGNWGMDDWLKRVSRERLEPYFRLHREANVNTIRNWVGQNTERVFFELADEYGLLVLNDFWISTQDHNGEPGDTALFLANAADTISRFRSHPSIALWIGRNEGVPPPHLNKSLERLTRELDGTRAYLPNSRQVNMSGSGPWHYQPEEAYFGKLARGFSTEIGTPSFPTVESFRTMMPEADQWPVSDSWAYHDWHQGRAGNVVPFMKTIDERLGAPVDLEDFGRKAQLLNYESHRAIFEGMNAGLFTRNSGRLLWMTHPAWPSTVWQIYSHDYDTHASFFGTKKGSEPVHVQLNQPDRTIAVANSLTAPLSDARIRVRNYRLDGTLLGERSISIDAPALATATSEKAIDESLFDEAPVILTRLELFAADGRLLSENFYWLANNDADFRAMSEMTSARISVQAKRIDNKNEIEVEVVVTNQADNPALMVKLSALDGEGERVLPAYWSDNYVSLLPGETRTVTIKSPSAGAVPETISIDGWNVIKGSTAVQQ